MLFIYLGTYFPISDLTPIPLMGGAMYISYPPIAPVRDALSNCFAYLPGLELFLFSAIPSPGLIYVRITSVHVH